MNDKKTIYMVLMLRWGDPTGHSYVIGFFSNKDLATIFGCQERDYRGGKYEFVIKEFLVKNDSKTIYLITKELNPRQQMFYKVFDNESSAKINLLKQKERKINTDDVSPSLSHDLKSYVLRNRTPKLTNYLIDFGESSLMDVLLYHLDDEEHSSNCSNQLESFYPSSLELYKTFQQYKYRKSQNEQLIIDLIKKTTDIDSLIEFLKLDDIAYKVEIANHLLINSVLVNIFKLQPFNNKVCMALISNINLEDSDLISLIKSNSLYLKAILREPAREYSKELIDVLYNEIQELNNLELASKNDDDLDNSINPYFLKTITQFPNTSTKILLELFELAHSNNYKFLIKEIQKHPNFNNQASLILETFKKL
jgi:hypothetical protein